MKPTGLHLLNMGRLMAGIATLGLSLGATAQDNDDDALEEIVVYSKTTGGLVSASDQPVAITVVGGAELDSSGFKDIAELQESVPGLTVGRSQTATTSNFSIRGIGSTSNNFGVESSVGLYVDGVYRSRQSSLINELVDVEAVEVLRGPQGTLFGKNTASGAINVRTVAPSTDGVDGFVDVSVGEYNLQRISAAANIPLSDNLAFRGTVFSSNRDGFVQEDNFRQQISSQSGPIADLYNDRDRIGLRAQLGYDNGDDLSVRVIADYAEIDEICCVGTTRVDSVFSRGGLANGLAINGPDAILLNLGRNVYTDQDYSALLPPLPNLHVADWEDYRTSLNAVPISQNEDRGLSLEVVKDFSNTRLTSITAFRQFETFDFIDADFTDTEIAERTNIADQQSISQELRLSGQFGEGSNWVVGAYYFAQDIDSNTTTVGGADLQTYVDLGQAALGEPTLSSLTDGVTAISVATGGLIPPGAPAFPAGAFADDVVNQEHDGYAVFGQVDWAVSDALTLSLGARYTDETKTINAVYTQTNPGLLVPDTTAIGTSIFLFQQWVAGGQVGPIPDLTPLLAVAQPNAGWAAWTLAPFSPRPNVNDRLEDDQVTGSAKATWFVNDTTIAYASYSTGFKAGGTNTDRIFLLFDTVFDAETSRSFEVGLKGEIGDDFRYSAAIYQTDFEDFQANSFTGTGFNLQNAGDLDVQGIELEWNWLPFDDTTISGYFAHNRGEFNSFIEGTCWDSDPFHSLIPVQGFDPVTETCNRSGEDIPYNPENRFGIAVTQNFPIGNNDLFVRVDYSHQSEFTTDGDNDPQTLQDDFGILNARIGFNIESWNSTITLWGRNITDERYYTGSFDPPLLDTGRTNSYPSEPGTYGISFRKNWD